MDGTVLLHKTSDWFKSVRYSCLTN